MSTLKVDKIDPQTGTALEIGSSGDTMTVPSGATLDISSATLTPPATMPASSAANLTSIPAANITGTLPAIDGASLTGFTASQMPAGSILQVKQTVQPAQTSASGITSMTDISGMSVSITPASGSKVLVQVSFGRLTSGSSSLGVRMMRGSTAIGIGTAVGNRQALTMTCFQPSDSNHTQGGQSMTYLDTSPGGDGSTAITYKMQWQAQGGDCYMNMSEGNLNESGVYSGVSISTITVWEIGA